MLVSAAMLLFELALTRIFAVSQFYHFAFMAISLALLGGGVSGSLLAVWRRRFRPALLAAGFAVSTLGCYLVINGVQFDSYAIAWDTSQWPRLAVNFLAAVVPFTFSGLVVGQLLESEPARAHRVYGANLGGSALGCVLVLPALALLGGEGTVLLAVAMGFAAAGLFSPSPCENGLGVKRAGLLLAAALVLAGAVWPPDFMTLNLSPYKALEAALRAPDTEHTFSAWSATARVDVVESRSVHSLLGLSMSARLDPPPQAGVTMDGDNLMPLTALAPDDAEAQEIARWLPLALPFALRPDARTLILEPGAGFDVLMARAAGAGEVTVTEDNALLLHVIQGPYAGFARHLYDRPRVEVVNEAGRAFARRTDTRFDVIDVALTDGFRPVTSGAYSLSETYRYTVEAFVEYLSALEDDGLLFVMRWLQSPPSEDARTLLLVRQALTRLGVAEPAAHIAALRTTQLAIFLVGRQPFTEAEIADVREFAHSRRFDLVLLPRLREDELNRYGVLPEPTYHNVYTGLLEEGPAMWEDYRYDIRPTTDDRPFFYHYFRWSQTREVIANLGKQWQPFGGSGYLMLLVLLALVGVASVVLIFGPLVIGRRAAPDARRPAGWGLRARVLVYFMLLGLAFLFVELPLAQRFIVYVGHPISSLAVVLFGVLLFSGLGSLTVPRWRLDVALSALVLVIAMYPALLPSVFDATFTAPLWVRVAVSLGLLAPLGLLMGVPFARGLAIVEARAPGLTPWAWAINGCASVISGILAVMAAMGWGLGAVLWLGAACYAGALLALWPYIGKT